MASKEGSLMLWLLVTAAIVSGAALIGFGLLLASDPEGRGGFYSLLCGGAGALLVVGGILVAVGLLIRWAVRV